MFLRDAKQMFLRCAFAEQMLHNVMTLSQCMFPMLVAFFISLIVMIIVNTIAFYKLHGYAQAYFGETRQ